MKTINITYLVVGIVGGVALTILGVLAYFDEKPRIKATGEYSSWDTPSNISFNGFKSYAKMDIRNVGDAEAKELKLYTPFRGTYVIDGEGEPQSFDNDILLGDLNPSEGYIIEIWSQTSGSWVWPGDVYITHTRGNSTADFGYRTIGVQGKIFAHLAQYWLLYVLLILIGTFTNVLYILELRKSILKEKSENENT